MQFKLSKQARIDLLNIGRYTQKKWGKEKRKEYLDSFNNMFFIIKESPQIGWERQEFVPAVRSYQHREHMIVYTIENDIILIVRILGKKMDISRHIRN